MTRPGYWLTACCWVALATVACGRGGSPQRPNIVLITMDTTRADRLGCYGYEAAGTPVIDQIAGEGTRFERAFTTAPITGPAHASILSGTYPPFHQVRDNSSTRVPEEVPWLADIVRRHGYNTAAVVAAYPVKGVFGFNRGFDYFSDSLEAPPGSVIITNQHTVGVASRKGGAISREFRQWLDREGRAPFFVWLHFYDPHWPWDPGGGYAEIFQEDLYDAEIAYMDDCIGQVITALEDAGLRRTTALVLVADHGEGLMDHGEMTHALLAYNTTVRVPLVIAVPWFEQVRRVDTAVSTVDLAPTILDLIGIDDEPARRRMQGHSLVPGLRGAAFPTGEDCTRALYFETFYPYFHYGWGVLTGVVRGRWKFIDGPKDELYDLSVDFEESQPVSDRAVADEFVHGLAEFRMELAHGRPRKSTGEVDRMTLEMLKSLGYVGGGRRMDFDVDALPTLDALRHPPESLASFHLHNRVLSLVRDGAYQEAADLCRRVVEQDPLHKDVRMMLVSLQIQLGNASAAAQQFEELLNDYRDLDVLFQAGKFYQSVGQLESARECFEEIMERDPEDYECATALGRLSARQGDQENALRHFEVALSLNPLHRDAMLLHAITLDSLDDENARNEFEAVARAYPFDPGVALNFGVYLHRIGERKRAVGELRKASALAEGAEFEPAHFALAGVLAETGEIGQARTVLRELIVLTEDPGTLRRAQDALDGLASSSSSK